MWVQVQNIKDLREENRDSNKIPRISAKMIVAELASSDLMVKGDCCERSSSWWALRASVKENAITHTEAHQSQT